MKDRYTILIVEDHPADMELIQLQLEKVDLNVDLQTTATKAELLQLLDDRSVDLVISDYNLEGFTGEDVLEIVRDRNQDLPFVMVTGYLGEKKAVQIMRAGASDYVMKDELDRLIPVVERELRSYEKRLKLRQERDIAVHDLEERVKEQKSLQELSSIEEPDLSIEEFLSRAVEILPPGWQYPEITEAIIEYDGRSYQTEHYRETQWTLTAQNKTIKNAPLVVKVVYVEEKPALDVGPFSFEEQNLIHSVLGQLSLKINRILDQKELAYKQDLLERSNALAKVGHWEVDLVESTIYWDREVKKIHEVGEDYTPTLNEAINFYQEGEHREKIQGAYTTAIEKGESFDVELKIVTGKGNERWIRAIGKPEFKEGECIRVYGSFQDIDVQKRTELELKEISEKHKMLSRVASETQNAVIITDIDRHIEWVNNAFEKLTGYSFEEVKGKNPDFLHGPNTDPKIVQFMHEKLENREGFNIEILNYSKTGEPYWIDLDVSPITDENEHVVQYFSIQDDITERKNFLFEIKEKEERLEKAQHIGKIGDWNFDIQTGKIFWSNTMYEIYDRDPGLGPPSYEELLTYYPENGDSHRKIVERAIDDGEDYQYDLKLRTKKGDEKYIHAEGFAKTDENGKVTELHGIVQDITERKEKELEIFRREKQLRSITNNVEAVVFRYVLKPDGSDQMMYVSDNIERLYEITAEQAMESTQHVWELVVEEDVQPLSNSIEESAETLDNWNNRFRVELPSRKLKWIQGHGHPIKLEDGSVQWDTMIIDVTTQVQQERMNDALVQEIHHRVKNNLAIITGFLQLQLLELPEDSRERLPLERAITRIYSIAEVHKLLYEGSNLMDIHVSEYLDHLVDYIMDTIKVETEVHVDMHIEEAKMNVNELTPLGMLMNELLTNSIKYAFEDDKKGQIKINLSKIDDSYHIFYKDSGRGIDKSQFEEAQGSGFNIVKILLEQLEAEYELDTESGFGLGFTFKERTKGAHGNFPI